MSQIKNIPLPPDILQEEVRNRIFQIQQIIKSLELQEKDAPEGSLRIAFRKANPHFFHTNKTCNKGTYIPESNFQLARKLAQKDYNLRVKNELNRQLKSLMYFEKHYRPAKLQLIFQKLHFIRKDLLYSAFLPQNDFCQQWQETPFIGKEVGLEVPDFFTRNNEHVRSKSEILIADTLKLNKIPYRYEAPVHLSGIGIIHPDFTCLNPRTHQEFLWEHFGLMDNPDYSASAITKILHYQHDEYFPGKKIIFTYESKNVPLTNKTIQKIIDNYLT